MKGTLGLRFYWPNLNKECLTMGGLWQDDMHVLLDEDAAVILFPVPFMDTWRAFCGPCPYDQPSALNLSELVPHLLTLFSLFPTMLAFIAIFINTPGTFLPQDSLSLLLSLSRLLFLPICLCLTPLLFQIFSLNTTFSWFLFEYPPPVPCLANPFLTIHFVLPANLFYIFLTYCLYSLCPFQPECKIHVDGYLLVLFTAVPHHACA